MFAIDEEVLIVIRKLGEASIDCACEDAYLQTRKLFGMDAQGYLKNVIGWERSRDEISLKFHGYERIISMQGTQHIYTFIACARICK